MIGVTMVRFC